MTEISKYDDIIDSRNIIERIEEIEDEIEDMRSTLERMEELEDEIAELDEEDDAIEALEAELDELAAPDRDELEELEHELKILKALDEEGSSYSSDWKSGEALIRDSFFTEYAEQLADDLGLINADAAWPTCHINWDEAADSLKQDYSSVDFDGTEYWVRAG